MGGFQELNAFHGDGPWFCFARVAVMMDGTPDAEGEANAKLIKASPNMLEALKGFVDALEKSPPLELIARISAAGEMARAVIAEIEGGDQ